MCRMVDTCNAVNVLLHEWCLQQITDFILILQADRQRVVQEPELRTGYKARVNRNHSNGTTVPSQKSFPALLARLGK
jgi:hypothetical protein